MKGNNMNEVNLIGRLTKEVEINTYGDKKNGGSFSYNTLAVRDGKDAEGNDRVQFIDLVFWNAGADMLSNYVHKGDMVGISGKLVQNNYEDKNGVKHYSMRVSVRNIYLLPNAKEEQPQQSKKYSRKG